MNSKFLIVVLVAIASAAYADTITWGTPTNETGVATDVVTTGTFLESAYAGTTDVTLNGVVFAHATNSSNPGTFADGSSITFNNVDVFDSTAGSAPGSWNASYQALTNVADYNGTNNMSITLGGLTAGQTYEVQIFEPWWNNQFPTTYTLGNASGALNTGVGQTPPQYVTGTFTATGTSDTISESPSNTFTLTSAIQVRDITASTSTVPEPSMFAVLVAGLLGIALIGRVRAKAPGNC